MNKSSLVILFLSSIFSVSGMACVTGSLRINDRNVAYGDKFTYEWKAGQFDSMKPHNIEERIGNEPMKIQDSTNKVTHTVSLVEYEGENLGNKFQYTSATWKITDVISGKIYEATIKTNHNENGISKKALPKVKNGRFTVECQNISLDDLQ